MADMQLAKQLQTAIASTGRTAFRREDVTGVPGAFLLRGFLDSAECVPLCDAVEAYVEADARQNAADGRR